MSREVRTPHLLIQAENFGNRELLQLSESQKRMLHNVTVAIANMTVKQVLFTCIPPHGQEQSRSTVYETFHSYHDSTAQYARKALTNHLNVFERYALITQRVYTEQSENDRDRRPTTVCFVEQTALGERVGLPAAYIAQNFEEQMQTPTYPILRRSSNLESINNGPFNNTQILLHAYASLYGINASAINRLTGIPLATVQTELQDLQKQGLLQEHSVGYLKIPGMPVANTAYAIQGKPSDITKIARVINYLADDAIISPSVIWHALPQEEQETLSLGVITDRLQYLAQRKKLQLIDSEQHALYEITEKGKIVTQGLLLPLVALVQGKKEIYISNNQGEYEDLYQTIIPRLKDADTSRSKTLAQYAALSSTTEAVQARYTDSMRTVLQQFTPGAAELLVSEIKSQVSILPSKWHVVIDELLDHGYIASIDSRKHGSQNKYAILPEGIQFLKRFENHSSNVPAGGSNLVLTPGEQDVIAAQHAFLSLLSQRKEREEIAIERKLLSNPKALVSYVLAREHAGMDIVPHQELLGPLLQTILRTLQHGGAVVESGIYTLLRKRTVISSTQFHPNHIDGSRHPAVAAELRSLTPAEQVNVLHKAFPFPIKRNSHEIPIEGSVNKRIATHFFINLFADSSLIIYQDRYKTLSSDFVLCTQLYAAINRALSKWYSCFDMDRKQHNHVTADLLLQAIAVPGNGKYPMGS